MHAACACISQGELQKGLCKWHGQDGNTGYMLAACLALSGRVEDFGRLTKKRAYLTAGALLPVMCLSLWSISGAVLELEYMHAPGQTCECYFSNKNPCL